MSNSSATPWTVAHQAPSVHGIYQAKILEWFAISFSGSRDSCISCIGSWFFTFETLGRSLRIRKQIIWCVLSRVWFFATPGTTRLFCPWDSPGKNTGEGCHFLLQGIVLTQGSNPGPLHWQSDSFHQRHLLVKFVSVKPHPVSFSGSWPIHWFCVCWGEGKGRGPGCDGRTEKVKANWHLIRRQMDAFS